MRLSVLSVCLSLVACSGGSVAPTTTSGAQTTVTVATAPPTTTQALPVEVNGCNAPPVTFSAMCEVYQLLQAWHVDQPLDPARLAELATSSLDDDLGDIDQAPLPRTLLCAIPDPAFTGFCKRLGEVIAQSGVAVGPVMDHVVSSMVEDGLGPFTYYLAPDQLTSFRSNGVVEGVGVLLDATDAAGSRCARLSDSCPLRVVFVLDENPGAEAGLLAGDVIVEVDGVSVAGQGFTTTAGHIAGDEQGVVVLTVERDGEVLTFDITRAELEFPTAHVEVALPGVAYLAIPDFEDDMPVLVRHALESLSASGAGTIVLDLRDNPGGFIDAVVSVASEFIAEGPVLEAQYPEESSTYQATGDGLAHDARVLVLINEGTASAAEILAGALRDRRGSLLLGAPTFGKNAIQIRFDLRNGGELDIAVARWATPNGHTVANGGLVPDRELQLTATMTIREIVEAALEAAS